MTELEILERADNYLQILAKGIDPISGEILSNDNPINHERMHKFFTYVSSVMKKVIAKEQNIDNRTEIRQSRKINDYVEYKNILISNQSISMSELERNIRKNEAYNNIWRSTILTWLASKGLFTSGETNSVTQLGLDTGIEIIGISYRRVIEGKQRFVYNTNAQKYIIDNLTEILQTQSLSLNSEGAKVGEKWTLEEEEQLKKEFAEGISLYKISVIHGRKYGGIRTRLVKLGLIEEPNVVN